MAYAIITTCFVSLRVKYFDNIFDVEFSAVYLRKRVISNLREWRQMGF